MSARALSAVAAVVAALGSMAVVVGVVWQVRDPGAAAPAPPPSSVRGEPPAAVAVLARWDRRRAAAYADGDEGRLRSLYVPRSRAGAADVAMLRRYAARGLRVRGMRTQLLDVRVLEDTAERLRLRVVERLTGAAAVRGDERIGLPRDGPSRRTVTLVRREGRWLVAEVG